MLTLMIFLVLLVLIMINVPIAVAMALTAIVFFIGLGNASLLTMLPQRMYASTTSFTLLAIPFFYTRREFDEYRGRLRPGYSGLPKP